MLWRYRFYRWEFSFGFNYTLKQVEILLGFNYGQNLAGRRVLVLFFKSKEMNKLCLILLFTATFSFAQTDLEPVLEFIAQQEEVENVDISYLRDELIYLQNHPLNLNKENLEVLLELGLLNELQYNELLLHLSTSGKLLSLYELQALKHWQKEDYLRIKPSFL